MRLFITIILCLVVLTSTAVATQYQVISRSAEIDETLGLGTYETVIQVGFNELDRFTMHRVVKLDQHNNPLKPGKLKGAFLLLPGGGTNFDSYRAGNADQSLVTFLAQRNVEVYGYSPRTKGLPAGYCDTNDCSPMAAWGLETYVNDIDYIRKQAFKRHHKRPLVGGYSLGAILSIASINNKPNGYAGAVLWEGALYYDSPLQEEFAGSCAALRAQWDSGQYYDAVTYPFLKVLISLYHFFPGSESPFAPGLSNRDFLILFMITPNDPPNGLAPGYTFAAGDFVNGLYYFDEDLLFQFSLQFNDYDPIALVRDYTCALSGDRTFTRKLGIFRGPVFSMQAGIGFGAAVEDNLALFGTTDITRYVQPNFGHGDFGTPLDYEDTISKPIWQWLEQKILPLWK
ncbi:MAG: hypothetical protein GY940_23915 [bacterium]|nr:hypothetical protein [bacterium]